MVPSSTKIPLALGLMFLVAAFAVSVVTPPFQAPDEFDHIHRAYLLTKGILILDTPPGQSSGGAADTGLLAYFKAFDSLPFRAEAKVSQTTMLESQSIRWTGEESFRPAPGMGYYFPAVYAPQALGIFLGRICGRPVASCCRLARFFALFAAASILLAALLVYPSNPLLFGILFLPMTLFQSGSASIDGITVALSALTVASFLRIVGDKEQMRSWMLWAFFLGLTLLATCKLNALPLFSLAAYLVLTLRRRLVLWQGAGATFLVAIWTLIAASATVDHRVALGKTPRELAFYFLCSPLELVRVLYASLGEIPNYTRSFIGVLGWLDASLPDSAYPTLGLLLGISAVFSLGGKSPRQGWGPRALLAGSAFAMCVMVILLMLVTWTPHPATCVQGVQGRYFLIASIPIAYALAGDVNTFAGRRGIVAAVIAGSLCLCSLRIVLTQLIFRYYL